MELGNILGKFKPGEKEAPKKFLALVLTDELVQAAIWHVASEQTDILALGIPVEWDGDTATTAELVTAVDATISNAIEGLTDEPNEVILGIPHAWTDKNGIVGSKRDLLKSICRELELKPIGFVVITDSILSYLKIQEGTPATAIMIQVSRDDLTLLLIRLGRIEAIETLGRSDDVIEDVIEGIARFKVSDNLPSRIILFDGMSTLDDMMQNLISVDWQSQFNFLHIPKVETLPKDSTIKALVVAGGGEVAKSLGFTLTDAPHPVDTPPPLNQNPIEPIETQSNATEKVELSSAADMGFTTSAPSELQNELEEVTLMKEGENEEPAEEREEVLIDKPEKKFVIPTLHLPPMRLPQITFRLPSIKKHVVATAILCIALALGIFWFFWMLPSAEVAITVKPKPLEQTVALTLSTTAGSIDTANAIVPAQLDNTSTSGDKTIPTTGQKTIGDPAKGNLTIYNRTSLTKTLNKGTSVAASGLSFTLDSDVTIASKSAGSDYVDVPGKATVGVTASAIGANSNLVAGTEFTILSFGKESYVGKNDVALGGGTSEQIQVVSKDDQKKLAKDLTDDLLAKLTTTASTEGMPGTGVYLLPSSAKLSTEDYSAKVGDKATTLTGSFTLSASLLRYQTQDVTTLINSLIDQSVPAGYSRSTLPATVDLSADSISDTGDTVKGTAKVQVALLPILDIEALKKSIKGESTDKIQTALHNQVPGIDTISIKMSPRWLPPRLKLMQHNMRNITITILPSSL